MTETLDSSTPAAVEPVATEMVAVLDFGSQYSQLITRRVREAGVYSELFHHDTPWAEIESRNVARHHPLGRPGQCLRGRRAATAGLGAGERVAGARHLLWHATDRAGTGRIGRAGRSARVRSGPALGRPRPSRPLFAAPARFARCLDEPRRPRREDAGRLHHDRPRATTRPARRSPGTGSSRSSSTPKSPTRRWARSSCATS